MYAPGYGFSNAPPTFNNAAPHPSLNLHLQPGSVATQPGQPMMYNPNQFAGMPGAQPGGFPGAGAPNPAVMSGPGPAAAMMQTTAMPPHMPPNGQRKWLSPLLVVLCFVLCSRRPPPPPLRLVLSVCALPKSISTSIPTSSSVLNSVYSVLLPSCLALFVSVPFSVAVGESRHIDRRIVVLLGVD